MPCSKFDRLVQCESRNCKNPLSVKFKMAVGAQTGHIKLANGSISLKFDTEFDHVTFGALQTFKVRRSNVNVTA